MKRFAVNFVLLLVVAVPQMFAQEFATDQILARLDEKAKAFKSVQSSIEHQKFSVGRGQAVDSGTFAMVASEGIPKAMLDYTAPLAIRSLLDSGKATQYNVADNVFREYKYNPKGEKIAFLMMGFGTPAASIRKGYTPAAKGREMVRGVNAVVLELSSLNKLDDYPLIRLWLDPQMWTPLQIRLLQSETNEKTYDEFRYLNAKLNQAVPKSAFDLKMKPGAKKQ